MRIFQKLSFLLIFFGIVTLASCNDDENNNLTKSDMLIGTWNLTKFETVIDGETRDETNEFVPNCTKDNTLSFEQNGVYKFDEGASKCFTEDEQSTIGTWSLNSEETKLIIVTKTGEDPEETILLSINNIEMKLSMTEDLDEDGEMDDVSIITMTKQ